MRTSVLCAPYYGEIFPANFFTIGRFDESGHHVLRIRIISGFVGEIMEGNRATRTVAAVGVRAVPGEAVVEVHVSGRNGGALNADGIAMEFGRHVVKSFAPEGMKKIDLIAPPL